MTLTPPTGASSMANVDEAHVFKDLAIPDQSKPQHTSVKTMFRYFRTFSDEEFLLFFDNLGCRKADIISGIHRQRKDRRPVDQQAEFLQRAVLLAKLDKAYDDKKISKQRPEAMRIIKEIWPQVQDLPEVQDVFVFRHLLELQYGIKVRTNWLSSLFEILRS